MTKIVLVSQKGTSPLLIVIILALVGVGTYFLGTQKTGTIPSLPVTFLTTQKEEGAREIAGKLVVAIKAKDMKKVAGYVHPENGLKFAPYINLGSMDKVFTANEVKGLATNATKYTWGAQDGSGFTLSYTFNEYYKKFIYDKDYAGSNQISQDAAIGKSSTQENIKEIYPGSTFVEYFVPGEGETADFDWGALRFVFIEENGKLYLVAIVHNGWTI